MLTVTTSGFTSEKQTSITPSKQARSSVDTYTDKFSAKIFIMLESIIIAISVSVGFDIPEKESLIHERKKSNIFSGISAVIASQLLADKSGMSDISEYSEKSFKSLTMLSALYACTSIQHVKRIINTIIDTAIIFLLQLIFNIIPFS